MILKIIINYITLNIILACLLCFKLFDSLKKCSKLCHFKHHFWLAFCVLNCLTFSGSVNYSEGRTDFLHKHHRKSSLLAAQTCHLLEADFITALG